MKQVIFDCDNTFGLPFKEIDDGLALIYLLGRKDIQLLGITTTFGNGTTDQAYRQTQRLLDRVNRRDIPVWRGQEGPGLGDNKAADFLAECAAGHPGKISLLATGPLTNLDAAARRDPLFFENIKEIACMGGTLNPLQIGWRRMNELNLSADSEAARTVLNAACPICLMSAQICLQAFFRWCDFEHIRALDPWLWKTIRSWLLFFSLNFGTGRFYLWDLVPAVYLSFPDLFNDNPVVIDATKDQLSNGILQLRGNTDSGIKINLPDKIIDIERFMKVVFEGWREGSQQHS